MKQRSQKQVEKFVESLWDSPNLTRRVTKHGDNWTIRLEQMYSYVDLSFKTLKAVSEFFGTDNIEDDKYHQSGCDTCDYGSHYQVTLTIRPEKEYS